MKKLKIFPQGTFVKDVDFESKKQYNLFVDFIPQKVERSEVNVLVLCEPDIISNLIRFLPHCHQMFDFILTHNENVLSKYENARLFVFNSVWATNKSYEPKKFGISTIVGNKTITKNQVLRQELWFKQELIPNRKFYASSFGSPDDIMGNDIIFDKKDELFNYQFHIAIENCSIENYFTEKILDCFVSKTVPIYCGCSNIGDFFNENGIIKFANFKECVEKCKNITQDTYADMLPFIEENYNKSLEYLDYQKRLKNLLKEISVEMSLL